MTAAAAPVGADFAFFSGFALVIRASTAVCFAFSAAATFANFSGLLFTSAEECFRVGLEAFSVRLDAIMLGRCRKSRSAVSARVAACLGKAWSSALSLLIPLGPRPVFFPSCIM